MDSGPVIGSLVEAQLIRVRIPKFVSTPQNVVQTSTTELIKPVSQKEIEPVLKDRQEGRNQRKFMIFKPAENKYINLGSTSSQDYFPQNTPQNFRNIVPVAIEPDQEYEVALLSETFILQGLDGEIFLQK